MEDHDHIPRRMIAEDIMEYCRANKKRFLTAKYTAKKIYCKLRKRPYTPNEMAAGLTYAKRKGKVEKVSNNRWVIKDYELDKEEQK